MNEEFMILPRISVLGIRQVGKDYDAVTSQIVNYRKTCYETVRLPAALQKVFHLQNPF